MLPTIRGVYRDGKKDTQMTVPVLTFFNNKNGVRKTSLVYHLA